MLSLCCRCSCCIVTLRVSMSFCACRIGALLVGVVAWLCVNRKAFARAHDESAGTSTPTFLFSRVVCCGEEGTASASSEEEEPSSQQPSMVRSYGLWGMLSCFFYLLTNPFILLIATTQSGKTKKQTSSVYREVSSIDNADFTDAQTASRFSIEISRSTVAIGPSPN